MTDPFDLTGKSSQKTSMPKVDPKVIKTEDPTVAFRFLVEQIGGRAFIGMLPSLLDFKPEFLDKYREEWEERFGNDPDPRSQLSLELTYRIVVLLKEFGKMMEEMNQRYLKICEENGLNP